MGKTAAIVFAFTLGACAGADKMQWPHSTPPAAPHADATNAAPQYTAGSPALGGPEVMPPDTRERYLQTPSLYPTTTPIEPIGRDEPEALQLLWPLPAMGVSSLFGIRKDPFHGEDRFHRGIDLRCEYGAVVEAVADGTVIWADWNGGHGRQVVIEHPGGLRSTYSHLSQTIVQVGMRVKAGHAVGLVGNSGRSTAPHLHFELTHNGAQVDPLDYLGKTLYLR